MLAEVQINSETNKAWIKTKQKQKNLEQIIWILCI